MASNWWQKQHSGDLPTVSVVSITGPQLELEESNGATPESWCVNGAFSLLVFGLFALSCVLWSVVNQMYSVKANSGVDFHPNSVNSIITSLLQHNYIEMKWVNFIQPKEEGARTWSLTQTGLRSETHGLEIPKLKKQMSWSTPMKCCNWSLIDG
jgi:hypothetical protein